MWQDSRCRQHCNGCQRNCPFCFWSKPHDMLSSYSKYFVVQCFHGKTYGQLSERSMAYLGQFWLHFVFGLCRYFCTKKEEAFCASPAVVILVRMHWAIWINIPFPISPWGQKNLEIQISTAGAMSYAPASHSVTPLWLFENIIRITS